MAKVEDNHIELAGDRRHVGRIGREHNLVSP
jgi:hypothetical protein